MTIVSAVLGVLHWVMVGQHGDSGVKGPWRFGRGLNSLCKAQLRPARLSWVKAACLVLSLFYALRFFSYSLHQHENPTLGFSVEEKRGQTLCADDRRIENDSLRNPGRWAPRITGMSAHGDWLCPRLAVRSSSWTKAGVGFTWPPFHCFVKSYTATLIYKFCINLTWFSVAVTHGC